MKLKHVLLLFVSLILVVFCSVSWLVGGWLVDFAFKRGNDYDSKALPRGSQVIISMNLKPPAKPQYRNETWTLQVNGEKRVATAFFATRPTNKWIIMVHGYCRDQRFVWYYAQEYLQRGYNVLTPDLNASGQSEGQYLTMGVKESTDVQKWAELLAQKYSQARIVLHGVSMGAATVMLAAEKPLPKQVYAVIEDCGYTSAYDILAVQLHKVFNVPAFPALPALNLVQKVKLGVALSDAAPLKQMAQCKLPMLFIHGDKDMLIPRSMQDELYNACGSKLKEKLVVPGAGHARAMVTATRTYFNTIEQFLKKAGA